jgi:hypothetical protein
MTPFDEAVLSKVMLRVRAYRHLHDSEKIGKLTMEQFMELALTAGYDEDEAQRAANKHGWWRLQAGLEM